MTVAESIDELRAEVERLQERAAYAERVWKELGASREQLQAEVERLRAALGKLRSLSDMPLAHRIADEALVRPNV